jgi:predicted nucleotidyltransferase
MTDGITVRAGECTTTFDGNCFTTALLTTAMATPDDRSDDDSPHAAAASAFARRVESMEVQGVESLYLFGSTARGEATGLESDVDFLAIVADDIDESTVEDRLRDVAYDVMLDHGPVVEVHILSRSAFENRRDHPFVKSVVSDGEVYV